MAVSREKKAEILKELADKFSRAKSVAWSHYQGLTANEIVEMRKSLYAKGVEFHVAKKTLIRKAAEKAGLKEVPVELEDGPVGVAFSFDDEVAPAKTVYTFQKDHPQMSLIGAWVEGRYLSKSEALELANVPGREELIAQFVYMCNAPLSGLMNVLSGPMRSVVTVIDAIAKKAPAGKPETPAGDPKAEANPEKASPAPAEPLATDADQPSS